MSEIRIMLVDDHEVVRTGVKTFLDTQAGLRVVAEASSGEKKLMAAHFILSSRYEYMFWEQAYRLQSWPV